MAASESLPIPKYNNDFSKPVTGVENFSTLEGKRAFRKDIGAEGASCLIDRGIIGKKLSLYDSAVAEHNTALQKELLKDKSVFAHRFFKLHGKPVVMRWYQDVVLSDEHDRILFASANQIGKSITLDNDAATEFLKDHMKEWRGLLVSNSLQQSKDRMASIRQLMDSGNVDYKTEITEETLTGKLMNAIVVSYTFRHLDGIEKGKPRYTNKLICCPHTSSALGYPCDNLWLDELEWWEDCDTNHFVYQIAIPRTFETNGKIKIYTNPNGKRMLWKLWNEKLPDGSCVWHRYHFNYWDRLDASQKDFDKKKSGMSRQQVESTLLAVFSTAGGAVFSSEEIRDMTDSELVQKGDMAGFGRETAWFLDVGSVHDQSVLVGGYQEQNPESEDIPLLKAFYIHKYPQGYPLARVVGLRSEEDDGWGDEAQDNPSTLETLQRYAEGEGNNMLLPLFGCDVTGNSGILPLFKAVGIDAVDVTFSGKRKWWMYQRFQYYSQQRWIKKAADRDVNTINGKDTDYQLSRLTIKENTRTVYRQIHHESEEDFDDCPDAIAGFIYLVENPDLPSLSFDIINPVSVLKKQDGGVSVSGETDEKIAGQYIPSFYDKRELESWIEQREKNRR